MPGRLIFSAIASLDGYVADAQGAFDWSMPDAEVHAFVNDRERHVGNREHHGGGRDRGRHGGGNGRTGNNNGNGNGSEPDAKSDESATDPVG